MTLILDNSRPKISCKTFGLPDNNLHIFCNGGIDIEIDEKDVCCLIEYFLTNVDLSTNDPRIELIRKIKESLIGEGHNKQNKRIIFPSQPTPPTIEL